MFSRLSLPELALEPSPTLSLKSLSNNAPQSLSATIYHQLVPPDLFSSFCSSNTSEQKNLPTQNLQPTPITIKTTMSAPIIKMKNTVAGFKSRIPVVSGPHRPDSNKPITSAALEGLPAGSLSMRMKSKIPILKNLLNNPMQQTPSSMSHIDAGKLVITGAGDQELQTPTTTPDSNKRAHDQQNSVLDTKSRAGFLRERIRGMNPIQSSLPSYKSVASTANKPLLNENVRPANSAVVIRKFSPPTGQSVPVTANKPVMSRKLSPPTGLSGQSMPVMPNKSVVTRKLSLPTVSAIENKPVVNRPPTGQSTPVIANNSVVTRKLSPPTSQSVSAAANKPAVNRKYSLPTGQSTPVMANIMGVTHSVSTLTGSGQSVPAMANKPVVSRKFSPSTGQSTPVMAKILDVTPSVSALAGPGQSVPAIANKPVVSRKVSPPTGLSAPVVARKSVVTRKVSPPTNQSVPVMANKLVVNRKFSPPTGQSKPAMANVTPNVSTTTGSRESKLAIADKLVVDRKPTPPIGQSTPIMANKPAMSRKISPPSSKSTLKSVNTVVGGRTTANTPRPPVLAPTSRVQELKAAIRQTKAARHLRNMRPRNAPLPGAPQIARKRIVLPGDYARPKRTVGKSKLRECSIVKSLTLNTKTKARMERKQKLALGPKGRAKTWKDTRNLPFSVRVIKRTAYAAMDNLPRGNPFLYAIHGDEE